MWSGNDGLALGAAGCSSAPSRSWSRRGPAGGAAQMLGPRRVILHIVDPRFLSSVVYYNVVNLADIARHVIIHILDPRFLNETASRVLS